MRRLQCSTTWKLQAQHVAHKACSARRSHQSNDWPSNYSLLRLWHMTKDLHQFADQLRKQMNHRHMCSHWEINHEKFASRVLHQLPAHHVPEATLQQNVQDRDFPGRRVRKKPPQADIDEFKAKCSELRRFATA